MRGDSWVRDSSKLLREKMFKNGKCVVYDEFDEDLHPRDEKGQFTSGGGESGGSGSDGEPRGSGEGLDLAGTKVGNTTYEQYSKMDSGKQFDTLVELADKVGVDDVSSYMRINCPDILQAYGDDIGDYLGVDTTGDWEEGHHYGGYNTFDIDEDHDGFWATYWDNDTARATVTEIMSEKDAKKCMDEMWDVYLWKQSK